MNNLIKTYLLSKIKKEIIEELLDEYTEELGISKKEYKLFIYNNIDYELNNIKFKTNYNTYISRNIFTINSNHCKARIWNSHRSSQCSRRCKYGDYCGIHYNMIKTNGCLRFNRIDEELPLKDNYTNNKLDWF